MNEADLAAAHAVRGHGPTLTDGDDATRVVAPAADVDQQEDFASRAVRRIARSDPGRPFVDDPIAPLTYGDLDDSASRIAAGLLDLAGPGEHRILIQCRSLTAIARALLGTVRAGMVPVLESPATPRARIDTILSDLEASLLFSDAPATEPHGACPTADPGGFGRTARTGELPVRAPSIATISYTSGSTGTPKGIVQTAALIRRYAATADVAPDGAATGTANRFAWMSAYGWSMGLLYAAAGSGGALVPYDLVGRGVVPLPAWLRDQRVSTIITVPTIIRALTAALHSDEMLPDLRTIVLSGEQLRWDDIRLLRLHLSAAAVIINTLALSEAGPVAHLVVSNDTEAGEGPVPPGRPLAGVEVGIVAADGSPLPLGEAGEIVVASDFCGVSYWHRPDLTEATFTALPDGRRRVRTGDGGRLLADGSLEHHGRLDHVVKVSGHRVELGEVEAGLRALTGVADAAVVAVVDSAGDTRLRAFVVATRGHDSDRGHRTSLRTELGLTLPRYMVPDRIEWLEALPRLPGGKIDRQQLASAGQRDSAPASADAATGATGAEDPASLAVRLLAGSDPHRLLVDDPADPLTYADANRDADRIAAGLLDLVGPTEQRVLVQCHSLSSIARATLGTRRAGMVPVIQAPSMPRPHIEMILRDLEAVLLFTDADEGAAQTPCPTADPRRFGRAPHPGELPVAAPSTATIMYTSGSTGDPKGIVQTAEFLRQDPTSGSANSDRSVPSTAARWAWLSAYGWSVWFLYMAAGSGSTLVSFDLIGQGVAPLGNWLRDQRVGTIVTVPSVIRTLTEALGPDELLPDLHAIVVSGEQARGEDLLGLRQHLAPTALIINSFGVSEAGLVARLVITNQTEIEAGVVPPGQPYAGVEVRVEGPDGSALPVGEIGELVVVGEACGVGYWRRPDMTAVTFTTLSDGRRQVRTGDAGRLRGDGSLEHLGRLDDVIKVSGHRIELGEVEARLRALPGVVDAVAVTYTDSLGATRLAAFFTSQETEPPATGEALRAQLSGTVPGYMLPDRISPITTFPRLATGKVDRIQLAATIVPVGPAPVSATSGDLTSTLCGLWASILSRSEVDADSNFFELGGDSLRASRLFTRIHQLLGYDRPMSLLVECPTPATLASRLLRPQFDWEALLTLNQEGGLTPLILVHDGAGEVAYARTLSAVLGPDQPIYGIRAVTLSGVAPREQSLKELASAYVARVQAVVPDGPYALYGSSVGGLIAFEMALQFQAQGKTVSLLALGDTPNDQSRLSVAAATAARGGQRRVLRTALSRGQFGDAATVITNHARWRVRQLVGTEKRRWQALADAMRTDEVIPPDLRDLFSLTEFGKLARDYRPERRFDGPALLFRASSDAAAEHDLGWHRLCTHPVRVIDVASTHGELGSEAGIREIGMPLRDALDEHARGGRLTSTAAMRRE